MDTTKRNSQKQQSPKPKTKARADELSDLRKEQPPQSQEAEMAVLGGVFLNAQIFPSLVDILSADDFYYPAHQAIFDAFLDLFSRNQPIDLVTTASLLKDQGQLEHVGGSVYLADLAQAVASAANAPYYARIVRDLAIKRQLIRASLEIIQSCYHGGQEVGELLDSSQQAVFQLAERTTSQVFHSSRDLVSKVFKDLEDRVGSSNLVTGVPTGYYRLDELTAGLQPSDLIIIAGRPSMGKTAFALNLALNAAAFHEIPTAVFSLEMSVDQLIQRLLCVRGQVDLARLRRGFLDDDDWTRLYDAAEALSLAPIYIDDTPALGTLELRARARRLKVEKKLGLLVVDYLQLMRSSRRIDSREQEISDISRNLKALAKELNVPVIALSQLNRKVEERTNKRPVLSDLRESGAIEQDADVIMFLYRDDVYNKKEDNPKRNTAEVLIEKQRNGPTGMVELRFAKECTRFDNLDAYHAPSEFPQVQ